MGQVDGYQVSDILVDYEAPSVPISQEQITSGVWERIAESAAPQACVPIGIAAHAAGMLSIAASVWERAAESGSIEAMANLGYLLRAQGDTDNARTWFARAADAGHTRAAWVQIPPPRRQSEGQSRDRDWPSVVLGGQTGTDRSPRCGAGVCALHDPGRILLDVALAVADRDRLSDAATPRRPSPKSPEDAAGPHP